MGVDRPFRIRDIRGEWISSLAASREKGLKNRAQEAGIVSRRDAKPQRAEESFGESIQARIARMGTDEAKS